MGTEKRARQKANRQARLAEKQAEQAKESREASTRKVGRYVAIAAAIIAIFVLYSVLTRDDEPTAVLTPDAVDDVVEPTPEIELLSEVPDDFEPFAGERALALVEPEARNGIYSEPPPMTIDPAKTYIAVIDTDVGEISVELNPTASPVTVNNFVALARDGFYDGTIFHRVLENFMAQGGDPTGTGTGGPGYRFEDEFDNELVFDRPGLLAMANSGANTNGSQFFLTFVPTPQLNGDHTIFGEIVRNEDVLADIVRVDPNDRSDDDPVTMIETIRIIES